MALGDLGLNNALGGMLGVREMQNRQALTGLGSIMGALNQARAQEEAQREAQMNPFRMQLMQAQADNAQRQIAQAKALDDAIGQLPPGMQSLARMSPQSFVSNMFKGEEDKIVPAGATLVRGGQPVYTNPKPEKDERSPFAKLLDDAGVTDPAKRSELMSKYLNKQMTHAPGASTTVVMNQEREEAKAVGKASGESFNEIQKSGMEATTKINRYDRIGQLLEGVSTGKLTPTATQVAALADSIGVKIDPKLGQKQASQALSNEIALSLRNPSGGAGMPGALSDRDREFLVAMTPALSNTPEGNRLLIDTAKKLAGRDQQVAKLARDYRARKGSMDPGFYEELQKFSDANPLFSGSVAAPKQGGSAAQAKPSSGAVFLGFE